MKEGRWMCKLTGELMAFKEFRNVVTITKRLVYTKKGKISYKHNHSLTSIDLWHGGMDTHG